MDYTIVDEVFKQFDATIDAYENAVAIKQAINKYGVTASLKALVGEEGLLAAIGTGIVTLLKKIWEFLKKIINIVWQIIKYILKLIAYPFRALFAKAAHNPTPPPPDTKEIARAISSQASTQSLVSAEVIEMVKHRKYFTPDKQDLGIVHSHVNLSTMADTIENILTPLVSIMFKPGEASLIPPQIKTPIGISEDASVVQLAWHHNNAYRFLPILAADATSSGRHKTEPKALVNNYPYAGQYVVNLLKQAVPKLKSIGQKISSAETAFKQMQDWIERCLNSDEFMRGKRGVFDEPNKEDTEFRADFGEREFHNPDDTDMSRSHNNASVKLLIDDMLKNFPDHKLCFKFIPDYARAMVYYVRLVLERCACCTKTLGILTTAAVTMERELDVIAKENDWS